MICKNCNKENIEGRKYCFYCGSELIKNKQETVENNIPILEKKDDDKQKSEIQKQPSNNKKGISGKLVALICVASVALISVSIAIIISTLSNNNVVPMQTDQESFESSLTESVSGVSSDSDYVLMPNCEKKKFATVKTQLEGMGLKIKETYEFSDIVEKDYVINQMDGEGTQLQKGDTVSLTISKGSDKCPYDYEQKLTVTASSGSSYGTAVLYEWQEGDWKKSQHTMLQWDLTV